MSRSRLMAVALALLTAWCSGAAGAQDVQGLAFDVSVTTGDSATGVTQTGHGWISGKRSRMDLRGPANLAQAIPGMPGENISLIIHDSAGAPVVAVVDHDGKKFMYPARMTGQLQELMASLPEPPRIAIAVTNVSVDTLGDGHTVSGFATKRFMVSADIAMSIEMMGESVRQEMRIESELDIAEALAEFSDPLRDTRGFKALAAGLPMVDSTAAAEFEKLVRVTPRGLALRQVDRITGARRAAQPPEVSTTLLTNVQRATFPLATFAMPDGYTELEMPMMPPGD